MAGMIVGFDNDDLAIFDEQFEFCQKAQIPIIMNSTLNASPKTPLAQRLQAEGRLLLADWGKDDFSHQVQPGATNFRPLRMTMDELMQGQKQLIRRLYEPEAFQHRLLGNLSRFRDVKFRPESFDRGNALTLCRLASFYWRQGRQCRTLFGRALWSAFRRSPRNLVTMATLLGKYSHILQLNGFACGRSAGTGLAQPRVENRQSPVHEANISSSPTVRRSLTRAA
jgi:hypothetical protein